MGYKSKFKGAEIDAILERCVFPSFFYDALIQDAVTKAVIDNLWQYMRERNMSTMHDVRLGMNLRMPASNEVEITSDLSIRDDELCTVVIIVGYDYDGNIHFERFDVKYPLAFEA